MRHTANVKPVLMGGMMGLMMLGMLHMILTGNSTLGGFALVGFVGVHLALVIGFGALGYWAKRFSPALQRWLEKLHRPRLNHVLMMLVGVVVTTLAAHLILHGLL